MNCSLCGYDVTAFHRECPNCGAILESLLGLPPELPICPNCGTQNALEARFCNQCGKALTRQIIDESTLAAESSETLDAQPLTTSENTEPAAPVLETSPSDSVEQQISHAPLPKSNALPILIGVGGFIGLICFCLFAITGYSAIRSWMAFPANNTPPVAGNPTGQVLIQSTKTQPLATRRPTVTIFSSFTASPTNTRVPTSTASPRPTSTAANSPPFGKIVFSCQMNGENHDQICIINADGSGWQQLTNNGDHNWYASISPGGQSVVYSSDLSGNYEIYEVSAYGGNPRQLTSRLGGKLYAPEISPDGNKIVFTHDDGISQTIWIMNRNGSNPHRISPSNGWDPSWTADGNQILFASLVSGSVQLFTIQENESNQKQVSNMTGLVGRGDWSPTGEFIGTYAGKFGSRSIYIIPLDGSNPIEYFFAPTAAAPSFSPDGQWIAFTGYIHYPDDFDNGCEIYLARLSDPKNIFRLTNNEYCDWQPRWGP